MIQFKVVEEFSRVAGLKVHDTDSPNWEARMACILVEKWGMVAAVPDGEDSAGRAKLRLLEPDELAKRACDTAAVTVKMIRDRGWVEQVPTLEEMDAELTAREHGKDER